MRKLLPGVLILGFAIFVAGTQQKPQTLNKLNVVALDAHGHPVANLTSADFQVYDDGKPQPIIWFGFKRGKPTQTPLAPGEYSNRSGARRDTVVILFDMLNERVLGDATVRTEIIDALKNLESGERIYLYLLTPRGEVFPVHPLPSSDTEPKPEAEPWTRQVASMLDQALKPFVGFRPVDDFDLKVRYEQTIRALNDLGSQMSEVIGRKNLVWVTPGFPIYGYSISAGSRIDVTNPLNDFYERLALSQIVVYPVDQSMRGAGAGLATYSEQTLQAAADLTGGRRLTSDRVENAITDALTDSRANYEIAYQTPAQKPDGKRHKVRVTTARKDVRLQTVQAYYVLPPVAPEDLERAAFETAIHSPFDATDIGVRASITPAPNAKSLNVNILVDRDDLLFLQSGQNFTGHAEVIVASYDPNGFQQASKPVSLDLDLTPDQLESASRNGVAIQETIPIANSIQRIRVIVYDPALNATGSVAVPVSP